ncbi:MAG: hypothetical protein PUG41_07360 [Prevotellaceae bacterium]|nr:hypothetical protein [Prevotellaceae bacterium]
MKVESLGGFSQFSESWQDANMRIPKTVVTIVKRRGRFIIRFLVENMFLMFAKILKYKQFVWCAAVSIAVEMLFLPIKNLKRNQTGATVWEICVFRK